MRLIVLLLALVSLALFFYAVPVDIYFSDMFFQPEKGFLSNSFLSFLHQFVYFLMVASCVSVSLVIAYKYYKTRSLIYKEYKPLIYLLLAFIIGPGLIVNMGFKEHSHRPRPSQTNIFTGEKDYTPPFDFTGQCESNCSFVSGHASVGFMFYAFCFIQRSSRRKKLFFIFATILGSIFGLARIMQGSHYLSDIIFSGVFVFITCYILSAMMQPIKDSSAPIS